MADIGHSDQPRSQVRKEIEVCIHCHQPYSMLESQCRDPEIRIRHRLPGPLGLTAQARVRECGRYIRSEHLKAGQKLLCFQKRRWGDLSKKLAV